ncbi:guanine nucleotide-binding protein G(I)/G(S)/G(O) subunit gamma-2 [Salvelinus namaycush]|uniref:Guanine nucleotide-binding protein subunit gamma n=1 Tax=Salvelinus namaycush TaxID=8040 RepID=A0A8U0UB60_SALNM|nr:guanine nucleotide-binding protein G(I)/G(S)/G(O) subunit gamma-2 [Salvelinus namaycush]
MLGLSHLFIAISLALLLPWQIPNHNLPPPQVSKAAADLMAYCDAHIREDPLIVPVPASENPFREKKLFCTIL